MSAGSSKKNTSEFFTKKKKSHALFTKSRFFSSTGFDKEGLINLKESEEKIIDPTKPLLRKEWVAKRQQEYLIGNFDALLFERGVELARTPANLLYAPLHYFDDSSMDEFDNLEWGSYLYDESGNLCPLEAKIPAKVSGNAVAWLDVKVIGYEADGDLFIVKKKDESEMKLQRIYILFDVENPFLHADRIAKAYTERVYYDSFLRYKIYVSNIPVREVNSLSEEESERIRFKSTDLPAMKIMSQDMIEPTLNEIHQHYSLVMNKINFDKFLDENPDSDLLTQKLILPKSVHQEETAQIPERGMVPLPLVKVPYEPKGSNFRYEITKDFKAIFKEFYLETILTIPQVPKMLQEINSACYRVQDLLLFQVEFTQPVRLEDFRNQEEMCVARTLLEIKSEWINNVVNIIKNGSKDIDATWFNFDEAVMEKYERGKLRGFLTRARLLMSDTLYKITRNSYEKFYAFISANIPKWSEIVNEKIVHNHFQNSILQYNSDSLVSPSYIPLFLVNIIKSPRDDELMYSTKPEQFSRILCLIFEKTLVELQKIPDIEWRIMENLAKINRLENKALIAPKLPNKAPEPFFPNIRPLVYPSEDAWVWNLFINYKECIEIAVKPLVDYLEKFQKHSTLVKLNPSEYIQKIEADEKMKSLEALKREIIHIKNEKEKIENTIPKFVLVSCFMVNLEDILKYICAKFDEIYDKILELITKRAQQNTMAIYDRIKDIQAELKKTPPDIESLSKLADFIDLELPGIIDKLKSDTEKCVEYYQALELYNHKLSVDDLNRRWLIVAGPKETLEIAENRKKDMEKLKNRYFDEMLKEQEEFKVALEKYEEQTASFYQYSNINNHSEIAQKVEEINVKLGEMQELTRKFNSREMLFSRDVTDYSKLTQVVKEFTPYSNLWKTVHGWFEGSANWLHDSWEQIDALGAEKFVEEGGRTLSSVIRYFRERDPTLYAGIIKIAENIKVNIDDFKVKVPLLVSLKKDGMKERHWQKISESVGFEIHPSQGLTFTSVLNMGMLNYVEICVEIGERAEREFQIESMLDKMLVDWEKVNFELIPYKNTANSLVKGFDEVEALLDDQLSNTGAMILNPYKKPFEERIDTWYSQLVTISNVVEAWRPFQGKWASLQPIFDSQEIARQLPTETTMFKKVDIFYKQTIANTRNVQNALKVCLVENFLDRLKESNDSMDKIEKELNNYLETKRAKFARFYFLSNDDLLNILSETKDVERVQSHLRKVFENINLLNFDAEKQITAMFSTEGEKIDFIETINPLGKNVEDWMGEVEYMMKESVKAELLKAINTYKDDKRTNWIFRNPGQCTLNGSQVHWTLEVEEAIKSNTLKTYVKFLNEQLIQLVQIDRSNFDLMKATTVEALIVIDVHALEVIENMEKSNINNVGAFEWISQLRYYWESNDCYAKCIQTNFPYGYEYLGNTTRLVITPLTDKCYMTLMGALKLNLGGAPAGPAGTGKTETTKDLAKALAKQCVVFNCQESMDYKFVGKYFKGLASSGAWCCFDEFNRINIEVLSVIAQQLQELFRAKDLGITELRFEDANIKILPTFCVYITMNPGYAGRTELPDNLKALFRPVAMMVPDYALIGQIKLYSFGFIQARDLARKMVVTFKLSSEQLSSQKHYDYGMRAVTSVINAAGLLKRAQPTQPEDQLLLRALRDVNVPKFLNFDIPLFENIIKDLFPDTERPTYEYGNLLPALKESCKQMNLQDTEVFLTKVLQLYDTIQVRHGLMLVGPTGGGKSSNYKVLQKAITSLDEPGNLKAAFKKVNVEAINPKSITLEQLYGETKDMNWNEGILEVIMEKAVKAQGTAERWWILFDGPVDAKWIESMNTVLDDNKKLCLSSGKVLMMSNYMTMMFEVEDLNEASPATVSRCGMVFMEPEALGIHPLINSYINTLTPNMHGKKTFIPKIKEYVKFYLESSLEFLRLNCKELVPTYDTSLVAGFFRLFECFIKNYRDTDVKKISPEEIDKLESTLEQIFVFCMIWSICCTTDLSGRNKFNIFLRELLIKSESKMKIPEDGLIYDYKLLIDSGSFVKWSVDFENYEIDSRLLFNEIVVPTNDYASVSYLTKLLITNKKHVLCHGPTGTGKSIIFYQLLLKSLTEEYISLSITLSAQTKSNQLLDNIFGQISKRRKGVFGPENQKKGVIFIDDLNMPKKEEYGAQPPLELIRQFMDYSSWYIFKLNKDYIKIEDLIIISAMGPPEGGRSHITGRLVRHFNMIAYTEMQEHTIKHIYSKILSNFLSKFNDEIRNSLSDIIEANLMVFLQVKNLLRPTPSKSHYTFNLRDISNVFMGICSAYIKSCVTKIDISRLWYHENLRVYHDRLVNETDRKQFKQILSETLQSKLNIKQEELLNVERILFCDFSNNRESESRPYVQILNLNAFIEKIKDYLADYNNDAGGKRQMKLVMFLDACEHIARIGRILRNPQGHALLFGVGGSGRQSLAKLSAYILGYKTLQVEVVKGYNITRWREDLKKLILYTVCENKQASFLLVDTQIIDEQMVEDVNCLLNTGNVVGIPFNPDEAKKIEDVCKLDCLKNGMQANKINLYTSQTNRVRRNSHIVFAMSPLGDSFTSRLRMFPSLINCCTIDWFTEWPEEALIGVGRGSLQDIADEYGIHSLLNNITEMFKNMHKSVELLSFKYLAEVRRYNYVTPTSFLELLNLYKRILSEKKKESQFQLQRFKNGLEKLKEAESQVADLKEKLREEEPKLKEAEENTKVMLEKIEKDKAAADEVQKIVSVEESEASKDAAEVNTLKIEADSKVDDANRTLKEIEEKMKNITVQDLAEIKMGGNEKIKTVIMAMCMLILLPKDVPNLYNKKDLEEYWTIGRSILLANTNRLKDTLTGEDQNFKREEISAIAIRKVKEKCMKESYWNATAMGKASDTCLILFEWVEAVILFSDTYEMTQPLRKKKAELEHQLALKTAALNQKKEQLEDVNRKIQDLQNSFNDKLRAKEELIRKINECNLRLQRAAQLTTGLADEKKRWSLEIISLEKNSLLIPGDSIIAAGMVAYSGPFISQFRIELELMWVKELDSLNIPHSQGIRMNKMLGDPVKIQAWNIAGLPKDDSSIENGIIMFNSRRWPLMIDPQNQANKFIKNLGKDVLEGMENIKASSPLISRQLEQCIQFGKWLLIENCSTSIDPSMEPILQQQVVKIGSQKSITLGDKPVTYNDSFKLFLTTTLPNPHYSPEICAKVTIINFAITTEGLVEQMLALIVILENPDLERRKADIVKQNASDKKKLVQIEDSILKSLSESKGDILMEESLINGLSSSKKMSEEISQRVQISKATEEEIDAAREAYRPVAFRTSVLFTCIIDLSNVDPMYQNSLQWFEDLFKTSVENSPSNNNLSSRLEILKNYFTEFLYMNVCRSLFEKHKILFSYLLTIRIQQSEKLINDEEWRYLLTGPSGEIKMAQNPTKWIAENSWPDIFKQFYGLNQLSYFNGILNHFLDHSEKYKVIYESLNPNDEILPGIWQEKLNAFQRILFMNAIRPDKVVTCVRQYVISIMGNKFVENILPKVSECYNDSNCTKPLIFILSQGSDPKSDFDKFANEINMKNITSISLGQGQGEKAEKMIKDAARQGGTGGWVLLQNCHLAITWMEKLEAIVEDLNIDTTHKDFRLWLTSMPTPGFPISVLQISVKMTTEPPQGLKANLKRSYTSLDDTQLNDSKDPNAYKKLIFGLCFFHAIVQDRRKFGAIGWNIFYEFTFEDMLVSKRQLKLFLDEYNEIPYKVLNFIIAEINYGGRVTDFIDKRLISNILQVYICPDILKDGHNLSPSGVYASPPAGSVADYMNYIERLPYSPAPEVFGLHDNAEITNAQNTTRTLLSTLLTVQPNTSAKGGKSRDDIINEIAIFIEEKTPPLFDIREIKKKYPTSYEESMNTVLVQEIEKYNRLLNKIRGSLSEMKKGLKGLVVMSEELDKIATALYMQRVPEEWSGVFLSLKPLNSWVEDLNARVDFIKNWVENGTPKVFWFSGLCFPQAFITGILQNYARRKKIAIDQLSFDYKFMDHIKWEHVLEKPEEGVYVYGLFIEGAKWDYNKHMLGEAIPKELFSNLPLVHLIPQINRVAPTSGIYNCPLYRVVSRAGTLSTTGHSTNFVMFLEIPSSQEESVWTRAGVAAFLALRS